MKIAQRNLIEITTTKKYYRNNYSLRARIGIRILVIIGVVTLEIID